jgi:hypothetical protein
MPHVTWVRDHRLDSLGLGVRCLLGPSSNHIPVYNFVTKHQQVPTFSLGYGAGLGVLRTPCYTSESSQAGGHKGLLPLHIQTRWECKLAFVNISWAPDPFLWGQGSVETPWPPGYAMHQSTLLSISHVQALAGTRHPALLARQSHHFLMEFIAIT